MKLQIKRKETKHLLGKYKSYTVYMVLSKKLFHSDWWISYFLLEKNGKEKRVYSKKNKSLLGDYFQYSISFIALKICKNLDSITFVGMYYNYFIFEAWKEDSFTDEETYIFYDFINFIIVTDQRKIEAMKAYLLAIR